MAAPEVVAPSDASTYLGDAPLVLEFTVDDDATPLDELVVTATSDDQDILPNANIVIAGDDENRTITLTPIAAGTVTITINVDDGTDDTDDTFDLTVLTRGVDDFSKIPATIDGPYLNAAAVTPHDGNELPNFGRAIYIGGAGDLKVTLASGNVVTFKALPVGTLLRIRAAVVWATGTTATHIVAIW